MSMQVGSGSGGLKKEGVARNNRETVDVQAMFNNLDKIVEDDDDVQSIAQPQNYRAPTEKKTVRVYD